MAFAAAVGQIYSVSFDQTFGGQKYLNNFKYRLDSIGVPTDTDTMAARMNTVLSAGLNLEAKFQGCLPSQVTHVNTWNQVIWPLRIRKVVFAKNIAGFWLGAAVTGNTAVSIERNGAAANKHNVGRVQIVSSDSNLDVANGSLTGALYIAALQAFATQMKATLTTLSGDILNPVLTRSPVTGTFEYIVGTDVKTTLRVMRRRTVGVGK